MARDYGYIISPSLRWYNAMQKGTTITDTFDLTNSFITGEPESQTFVISTAFLFQENGQKVIYTTTPADKKNYDLSSWITLTKTEITLKQNETAAIPYTITIPEKPLPGGKYAAIIIQKKGDSNTIVPGGASLEGKIAYEILGKVADTESVNSNSEVVSFALDKSVFWMWPNESATFTLNVKNTGNIEYVPAGDIFVHSGDITKAFWNSPINSVTSPLVVLPENTRSFTIPWNPSGPFIKATDRGITINLDYFRFGQMTATAKVSTFINGKQIITDRYVSFWVIPMPLILTILGTTLIVIAARLLSTFIKKNKRHG